ncbi:unnamed protein product [Aphanomyces euteiches]
MLHPIPLAAVVSGAATCLWLWRRLRTLQDELDKCKENLSKKELARQEERVGRTSAEKELRLVLAAKLNVSAGYYVQPIGAVESCFSQCLGTPRQGLLAPHTRARIVFNRSISPEALDGLNAFGHVWITFVFHCNTNGKNARAHEGLRPDSHGHTFKAKISPPMLKKRVGVFATRTPHRPNPIGIALAKIDKVDGRTLWISAIDLVEGTPVLDIKPYVPKYDSLPQSAVPAWIAETYGTQSSVRFAEECAAQIETCCRKSKFYKDEPDNLRSAIEEVLAVDVRSQMQTAKMQKSTNRLVFDTACVEYEVESDASVVVLAVHRVETSS